ncbi:MAG: hypothetical protein ACF8R7_06030 [Phycisphaerales bacterium JB039]
MPTTLISAQNAWQPWFSEGNNQFFTSDEDLSDPEAYLHATSPWTSDLAPATDDQRLVVSGTDFAANNLELSFIGKVPQTGDAPYHAIGALWGFSKLVEPDGDYFARYLAQFELVLGTADRASGSSILPSGAKFVRAITPTVDRSLFPGIRITGQEGQAAAVMTLDAIGFFGFILELRAKKPAGADGSAMSAVGALRRVV